MGFTDPIFLISLAGGLTILFFGRKLFWLYIGFLGVLAGFELTQELFPQQSEWLYLIIGVILGAVMALLAMALQYAAVALAGFGGGAYAALQVMEILPMVQVAQMPDWILLVPGAIGALLCLVVFNPALIVLSSLTGAAILVQLIPLEPLIQNALLVLAALTGITFQFVVYQRIDKKSKSQPRLQG
ncbi:MAG: DUF4203 domain-containing protein [Pseudohongiella sp.]|nr:DUF4203 domain-containing protein [Pseudohongiella sp.]